MIRIRLPFAVPELRAERGDLLVYSSASRRFVVGHDCDGEDALVALRVMMTLCPDFALLAHAPRAATPPSLGPGQPH